MKLASRFIETGDVPVRIISLPDDSLSDTDPAEKSYNPLELRNRHGEWTKYNLLPDFVVGSGSGNPYDDEDQAVNHDELGSGTINSITRDKDGKQYAIVDFDDPVTGSTQAFRYRDPSVQEDREGWVLRFSPHNDQSVFDAPETFDETPQDAYDRLNEAIKHLPKSAKPSVTPEPLDVVYEEEHHPFSASSKPEFQVIHEYTDPDSTINKDLRKMPAGSVTRWNYPEVLELDSMMTHHASTRPSYLYRGFTASPDTLDQLVPGQVFDDHAFVSTAWDPEIAKNFAVLRAFGEAPDDPGLPRVTAHGGKPVLMKINAPAGSHMIIGESDIAEYVLPRDSQFKVTDVSPDGSLISVDLMPA